MRREGDGAPVTTRRPGLSSDRRARRRGGRPLTETAPLASQINPPKPEDGVTAVKADLRANLQAAKAEIEALQAGKAALAHAHELGDLATTGTPDGDTLLRGDGVWGPPLARKITVAGAHTLGPDDFGNLLTYGDA